MNKTVTAIITDYVQLDKLTEYKNWQKRISEASSKQDGFISSEVIAPREERPNEYTIILRFASLEKLRGWYNSEIAKQLLEELKQLVSQHSNRQYVEGLEMFLLPELTKAIPYHKRVMIGVIAVYPLILIVNTLLELLPIMRTLSFPTFLFFSVIFVSMLMTYPVMPMLNKVLSKWLYK